MRHISKMAAFIAAFALIASAVAQQVSDDFGVILAVTEAPSITLPGPAPVDVLCTATSTSSACSPDSSRICFATNLTDIRVSVSTQNPVTGGEFTLVSPDVSGDYVSYSLASNSGVTGAALGNNWIANPTDDISLSNAITGFGICGPTDFGFVAVVDLNNLFEPAHRSVAQVIADNDLADGVTRTFSDVVTVTFEPAL